MTTAETIKNLQASKLPQTSNDQTLEQLEQISELLVSMTTLLKQQKQPLDLSPVQKLNQDTQQEVTRLARQTGELKQELTLSKTNVSARQTHLADAEAGSVLVANFESSDI